MPFDIDARIEDWRKALLDTTKRNRLVKFATGRGGGVGLLHPGLDALWQRLVVEGRTFTFPWKRDLLGLAASEVDRDPPARDGGKVGPDDPDARGSVTPAGDGTPEPPGVPGPIEPPGREAPAEAGVRAAPPQPVTPPPTPADTYEEGDGIEDAGDIRPRTIEEITAACLDAPDLGPDHLVTEYSDKKLAAHLLRLARAASEAETEHGVSTLYAAFGFLRWAEAPDSREELRSPLVLVPVRLDRESVEAAWTLRAEDDDPAANHCLAELLAADFRVRLPDGPDAEIDTDGPNGLAAYLRRVAERVASMPGWGVVEEAAIGVFNFQKLAMWEDLGRNADRVKGHPLCRAIAGDGSVGLRPPADLVAAADLDETVPPEAATHILDADSSQHEAVEAVKRGADVVIDGPPGTGKSQTIANCIAELLAAGKTVLFVSEKTAALEVVKRRLDDRGLGDFCLELHSHKANKREVAAELGRCLELGPEACPDVAADLRRLADDRRRLNAYAAELHRPRPPLGLTAYQVHGELARLAETPGRSRWAAPDVSARDAEFLRRATDALGGLARCGSAVTAPDAHPWRGCRLAAVTQTGLDDARYHLGRVAAGAARLAEGATLADLDLGVPADTVGRWRGAVGYARTVLAVPPVPPGWFAADPLVPAAAAEALHAATARARVLAGSLGDFSPDAVRRLEPGEAAETARTLGGGRDLLAGDPLTARGRVGALEALADILAAAAPAAERLAAAADRLLAELRVGRRAATVAQVRGYARAAGELARAAPVRPSWWDAGRRAEVRAVAGKAAEAEAEARAVRGRLAATLSPAAFAPEAAPVVRAALDRGGSFWRRLLPGWGAVRRQAAAWYAGSPPGLAGLMADLGALAEFHRRADYARQVEAGYAADLAAGPTGRPDWAATAEGLAAAERFERWSPPAELKAAMAPGGGLDRAALAAAAEAFTRADREFQGEWAGLSAAYAPADPAGASDRPAGDLAARLRGDADAARAEAAALGRLAGLLRDGHDLPPGAWAARAGEVAELVGLRARAAAAARTLKVDGPPGEVEATDWSALAAAGAGLKEFLARAARPPAPAAVAALSDPAARERVRAAVEASDRAVRDGFEGSWEYLTGTLFPPDRPVSDGVVLSRAPVPDAGRWAAARVLDLPRLEEWVRYGQVRREAAALGVESVVDEVGRGEVPADRAADAFRGRFLGLWLDELYARVPELADFSTDDQDDRVGRFARLDRLAVGSAAGRLRSRLLGRPGRPRADGSAPASSELGLLLREANKKRRHLPVRRLFAEVPTVLPRLKPCLMMSPLAVSTYLNSPALTFDVVIFDEASQVRPHDAVCAVYRGRQLVVAGDPKQLPPTDFFARAAADDPDADEADGGTAGFESLLDVCLSLGLVRKRLRWHYRSRHEGLIAFSNKYFYDGGLVTFPGADDGGGSGVRFDRVAGGRFEDGVNVPEARRAAALVIDHFRTRPDLSLGVIAFSQRQQNRILDELEALRRANPDLEGCFKEDRPERFFAKNLENVQGDERDVILLSVGYGPDAAGKVAMRFGPLNRQGGERRLNVAVTRARAAMTVLSSLGAADIDLSRTRATGAVLLRAFLDYAERGPRALAEAVTEAGVGGFDSPFEREVFEELTRRGLTLHPQVGCGGFRIDMAVADPGAGGRYLLGVECDGAAYHASATARDRDRLRQAVLEGLGWRLCRIWSTDWLRNREKQVRRVFAALEACPPPARPPAAESPLPEPKPAPIPPALPKAPPPPPTPTYSDIDKVPEPELRAAALAAVADYGATEPVELCTEVARRLGFRRTGGRIRARVEGVLNALGRERKLERHDDGRWGPPASTGN